MIRRLFSSLSVFGLFLGLLFLCASLTPSLLPRTSGIQGALSGVALAVGYGTGWILHFLWRILGFSDVSASHQRVVNWALAAIGGTLALLSFTRIAAWQNSIRDLMGMEDVDSGYPILVAGIAIGLALLLLFAVRFVIRLASGFGALLDRVLPRPVAYSAGGLLAIFMVFTLANDFVVQKALRFADDLFARLDQVVEDGVAPPIHRFASGGPASVIAWEDIGTNGKDFLVTGPSQAEIAAFTDSDALEPGRVYAGFRSGEDFAARAEIALQDLIAMGGFERSVLVVATPTGTGWLDPAAVEPITYMHGGDIAIVAAQYTYVPSWLSIMVEPDRSRLAARALFLEVYDHWTDLPDATRPDLYLFGLSLGALGSEASADLVTIFADPIDGALWSGPPFASTVWASATAGRNPGSRAWLPEFRDGSLLRFMNQDGIAVPDGSNWGEMRLLYLQYASDPMVFFSPNLAFRRPDWLGENRGPDVSPLFDWYPLVTFLQVGFDVPMATSPPSGFGHTYDALDYIEGWIAVTQPDDWSDADTDRLMERYANFEASPL